MEKGLFLGFSVIVLVVCVFSVPMLGISSQQYRLIAKYGRQIPTAPIEHTVAWHLKNGN